MAAIHLLLDLDETLITTAGHRPKAALAGVLSLARAPGFEITSERYAKRFNEWAETREAEAMRAKLSTVIGHDISRKEAFLYSLLNELYEKNPNDLRQYDQLIKRVSPRNRQFKDLVSRAVYAYHHQRNLNMRDGLLKAMPFAQELLERASGEGLNIAIVSKGSKDKQQWKLDNLVYPGSSVKGLPLFHTSRKFLWWKLPPGNKTPGTFAKVKKALGVKKGDLTIMVGDRHDQDVLAAQKGGFDYTIHVPGRRDQRFREDPSLSNANVVAPNLEEAWVAILNKVNAFRSKNKT